MHRPTLPLLAIFALLVAPAFAGDLEPSDPPGSTMRSLDELPPTWSARLSSTNGSTNPLLFGCGSSRFDCVFAAGSPVPLPQAVLDKETGLVWERSPAASPSQWETAVFSCYLIDLGRRKGWRLPTVEELSSLIDTVQTSPALPDDHPFINLHIGPGDAYWTQTTSPSDPTLALQISFESGFLGISHKTSSFYSLCVRGGHGFDSR